MFQTVFSVHHQKHKTAHTASGICRLLLLQLLQQVAVTVYKCLTKYVQFCAPDDGRKNRLKRVEHLIEINIFEKCCILLVVLCE